MSAFYFIELHLNAIIFYRIALELYSFYKELFFIEKHTGYVGGCVRSYLGHRLWLTTNIRTEASP